MLAERLPGLLPELDDAQAMEVTAVASVLGRMGSQAALERRPPFVAPTTERHRSR
jgi:magnesium chelatase family protein